VRPVRHLPGSPGPSDRVLGAHDAQGTTTGKSGMERENQSPRPRYDGAQGG